MTSKRFQLLVIGNEILSGRRQDVHFANARAAFAARGLRLSARWSRITAARWTTARWC